MSKINHQGRVYEVSTDGTVWTAGGRVKVSPEVIEEGMIFSRDDITPLAGAALERVRARMLGWYADMPRPRTLADSRWNSEPQRWLIPKLLPWETYPMLGGNPKAGKTTLVVDLVAALLVPGRRFLGHFEPAQVTEKEREQGIWLISAEMPSKALEEALGPELDVDVPISGEMVKASRLLNIDHLEQLGGAHMFDLTDPEIYERWAHRLIDCDWCDGSDGDDYPPPFMVIVDGLTTILQAAGKGVEAYGQWYAAFRRLMKEVDVPNALVVAHNTMAGGHLMGGVEGRAGADGLWTYSSDNPDDPRSKRRFGVVPRLGGAAVPLTEVRLVEGRPVMVGSESGESASEGGPVGEEVDEVLVVAHRHAAYVQEHPGVDGQALTDNVDAGGWKQRSLDGRARAIELGLIREENCTPGCSVCEKHHHRRRHYWPTGSVKVVDGPAVEAG